MIQGAVAAMVTGTLLCVATAIVIVVSLALANTDRLKEKRAAQRHVSSDDAQQQLPLDIELVDVARQEQQAPRPRVIGGELEGGATRERAPPYEDGTKVEGTTKPLGLPWPLLVLGNSALCGAEPAAADDDAASSMPVAE